MIQSTDLLAIWLLFGSFTFYLFSFSLSSNSKLLCRWHSHCWCLNPHSRWLFFSVWKQIPFVCVHSFSQPALRITPNWICGSKPFFSMMKAVLPQFCMGSPQLWLQKIHLLDGMHIQIGLPNLEFQPFHGTDSNSQAKTSAVVLQSYWLTNLDRWIWQCGGWLVSGGL